MRDLLISYMKTLDDTRYLFEKIKAEVEKNPSSKRANDLKTIRRIISDLEWTIEFIEKGRQPGLRRSINRQSEWRRLWIQDPEKMALMYSDKHSVRPNAGNGVTEEEAGIIKDYLSVLTDREKEIYVMHEGEKFSYERIAAMLGVAKSTVQTTVRRARVKISKRLHMNKGA
ncbi:sigma factor-like helix-turn-helix DNA-binding protein (plasmid) [Bacillus velezensis]|uniref:sigma factor-like helix-turn-helix DNA-binding protein n=1 Tax=Bacillus velezensis TaxID=492670 RepID=UPI002FFF6A72